MAEKEIAPSEVVTNRYEDRSDKTKPQYSHFVQWLKTLADNRSSNQYDPDEYYAWLNNTIQMHVDELPPPNIVERNLAPQEVFLTLGIMLTAVATYTGQHYLADNPVIKETLAYTSIAFGVEGAVLSAKQSYQYIRFLLDGKTSNNRYIGKIRSNIDRAQEESEGLLSKDDIDEIWYSILESLQYKGGKRAFKYNPEIASTVILFIAMSISVGAGVSKFEKIDRILENGLEGVESVSADVYTVVKNLIISDDDNSVDDLEEDSEEIPGNIEFQLSGNASGFLVINRQSTLPELGHILDDVDLKVDLQDGFEYDRNIHSRFEIPLLEENILPIPQNEIPVWVEGTSNTGEDISGQLRIVFDTYLHAYVLEWTGETEESSNFEGAQAIVYSGFGERPIPNRDHIDIDITPDEVREVLSIVEKEFPNRLPTPQEFGEWVQTRSYYSDDSNLNSAYNPDQSKINEGVVPYFTQQISEGIAACEDATDLVSIYGVAFYLDQGYLQNARRMNLRDSGSSSNTRDGDILNTFGHTNNGWGDFTPTNIHPDEQTPFEENGSVSTRESMNILPRIQQVIDQASFGFDWGSLREKINEIPLKKMTPILLLLAGGVLLKKFPAGLFDRLIKRRFALSIGEGIGNMPERHNVWTLADIYRSVRRHSHRTLEYDGMHPTLPPEMDLTDFERLYWDIDHPEELKNRDLDLLLMSIPPLEDFGDVEPDQNNKAKKMLDKAVDKLFL